LKLPLKLKWRRGKDWPFGMYGYPRVVVLKEKVYIGGGGASSDREGTVMVYDPKQDSHDTLYPYTYKRFSMAVVNNQLVLVGGTDIRMSKVTNKLGVWNEQSKRWTHPLPPMTTACNSPSVATHNNRWLVVMGGYDGKTHLSRVEILDTDSTQWYHAASLPQPLSHSLPAIIGNMCYLLGGYTEGGASQKVFSVCLDDLISQTVSQPASDSAPITPSPWQSLPDTPLNYCTALVSNGALLAVGGGNHPGSTAIYQYQPSSRSWVNAGELPIERSHCTCTVLPSGDLYVAGGVGATMKQVDIASVQVQ
jgi:N-acetylneuraminic acid mutarotase